MGGQRNENGVQLRWLLLTDLYTEVGAELGRGATFPGSQADRNGAGATTLFGHAGGDVGASHSWRAGVSLLQARPDARVSDAIDTAGALVGNAFTGTSRLWVIDGAWKWAPNGNATRTNFKLQRQPARLILRAAYNDGRGAEWLAERSKLPVVVLPFTVGGSARARDLFGLFDDSVALLLKAAPAAH